MTTSRRYTLITPRADSTGPTNVAVDIGRAAVAAGWEVRLLYVSPGPVRSDIADFAEVRRLRLRDLWKLDGVVHTHCLRPDLVGWAFTWNPRCHVMTTIHNYFKPDLSFDHPRCAVHLAWWLWSRALRRFAHRVCISTAMQRYYHRALPTQRFDLAYNFRGGTPQPPGALPTETEAWIDRQRAQARLVLAFVGALGPRKNVVRLLQAVVEAPEIALVLCGDGPQASALRARAKEPDLVDRVMFTGQVSDPAAIVGASDALVLPSLAEGLPLVVLEAARMGRPALMSNIAVHRELAAFGFGETFNRHDFSDFRAKAHALAGAPGSPPDAALVDLWRKHFAPERGFRRYAELAHGAAHSSNAASA